MTKSETVRKPLSANEVFELGIAVFQQLPRDLDPDKVRADLGSKGTLGRDLGKFFRDRYAAAQPLIDKASWGKFYRDVFGKEVDLLALSVPAKPDYPCWPILVVPGLVSNNEAFDASKKVFGDAWRYVQDLNTVYDIVERPKGPYVAWAKAVFEADSDLANVSAEQIAERKLDTLTLFERFVLGLKQSDEGGPLLDVEGWTLCAGSRYADGDVPSVCWNPAHRRLDVCACGVRSAGPYLRARAAVVPDT